jgi:hypothetical protein
MRRLSKRLLLLPFILPAIALGDEGAPVCKPLPEITRSVRNCQDNRKFVDAGNACIKNVQTQADALSTSMAAILQANGVDSLAGGEKTLFDNHQANLVQMQSTLATLLATARSARAELDQFDSQLLWPVELSPQEMQSRDLEALLSAKGACYGDNHKSLKSLMASLDKKILQMTALAESAGLKKTTTAGYDNNLRSQDGQSPAAATSMPTSSKGPSSDNPNQSQVTGGTSPSAKTLNSAAADPNGTVATPMSTASGKPSFPDQAGATTPSAGTQTGAADYQAFPGNDMATPPSPDPFQQTLDPAAHSMARDSQPNNPRGSLLSQGYGLVNDLIKSSLNSPSPDSSTAGPAGVGNSAKAATPSGANSGAPAASALAAAEEQPAEDFSGAADSRRQSAAKAEKKEDEPAAVEPSEGNPAGDRLPASGSERSVAAQGSDLFLMVHEKITKKAREQYL